MMAWTQAQLDEIESAMKSGVQSVKFNGRETTFRSLDEMRQIISDGRKSLAGTKRKPYLYTSYKRGYQ
jgi:hypothetical protein